MKHIIILISIVGVFSSCYKDKGNYDYTEINKISINGIDSLIKCDQMDLLNIPVTLEGTQYADSTRFTYEWEVNRKVIATTKNLSINANFPLGESDGRFIITDKELGTKAFKLFKIDVANATAGDMILVLSKYKGHAELSSKRLDKDGYRFSPNYYYSVVGNYLGTNPQSLHRNYVPEKTSVNSGLKVLVDNKLKCLNEETLIESAPNQYVDQFFFIKRMSVYPPEVTLFDISAVRHQTTTYGNIKSTYLFVVVNGALCHDQYLSVGTNELTLTFFLKKSPFGGKLSSSFFPASLVPSGTTDYVQSDFIYVFDDTHNKFVYANGPDIKPCPELGEYPGYSMSYSSHTSAANYGVAVLRNGQQTKLLSLKVPGKANQIATIPFTVISDLNVSDDIINNSTSYYMMKTEEYMMFATNNKLYRYNLRNLQDGIAPGAGQVIVDLSSFGYGADAKITCMDVSRTEKEILLGVSRYGNDTDGMSDELKGDVLVLDLQTRQLIKKYEGISGNPVDVKIKYQKYLRDGKLNGTTVSDNLFF